jgi:hypothetical protein
VAVEEVTCGSTGSMVTGKMTDQIIFGHVACDTCQFSANEVMPRGPGMGNQWHPVNSCVASSKNVLEVHGF